MRSRVGSPARERVKRCQHELRVGERRPHLTAEAAVPPHRRGLISRRLPIEQEEAQRERILERNTRKLGGRRHSDRRVTTRDGALQPDVWGPLGGHEQMFA